MRVAYYVAEYGTYAGSHASLAATIATLRNHNVQSCVLLPSEGLAAEVFRSQGWSVEVLPTPPALNVFQRRLLRLSWFRKLWIAMTRVLPYSFAVWRWLRQRKIDVLHCNSTRAVLLAGAVPWLAGVPIVLHGRMKQVNRGILWWLAQSMATQVIVVAEHLLREANGRFRGKFQVIRNAVDEETIRRLSRDEPKLPPEALDRIRKASARVLTLASVDPRKGIHTLVKTAARLKATNGTQPLFIVVGTMDKDRVYVDYIRKLCAELAVENVLLVGWLANPYPLLRAADVVVVPSLDDVRDVPTDNPRDPVVGEGMPRVVLEAMALGKPIVASAVAGLDEALEEDESGILVTPGSAEELARVLTRVLAHDDMRASLGSAAQSRAGVLFAPRLHAEGMLQVYRRAVARV